MRGIEGERLPELQQIAAHLKAGDQQTAHTKLAAYLKANPDNPAALYLATMLTPDVQRQIDLLQRALKIDPTYERVRKKLDSLAPARNEFEHLEPAPAASTIPAKPPAPRKRRNPLVYILLILVALPLGVYLGNTFVLTPMLKPSSDNLGTATARIGARTNLILYCKIAGRQGDDCDAFADRVLIIPEMADAVVMCESLLGTSPTRIEWNSFGACMVGATDIVGTQIATRLPTKTPEPSRTPFPPTPTVSPADREKSKGFLTTYCGSIPGMNCEEYVKTYLVDDADVLHILYCGAVYDPRAARFGSCVKDLSGQK